MDADSLIPQGGRRWPFPALILSVGAPPCPKNPRPRSQLANRANLRTSYTPPRHRLRVPRSEFRETSCGAAWNGTEERGADTLTRWPPARAGHSSTRRVGSKSVSSFRPRDSSTDGFPGGWGDILPDLTAWPSRNRREITRSMQRRLCPQISECRRGVCLLFRNLCQSAKSVDKPSVESATERCHLRICVARKHA